jgi:tetratricopeptide (TPR) repeat protein
MQRLVTSALLLAVFHGAATAAIVTKPSLFSDPKFAKEFVGSYGILSDVEPRVSAPEQELLGRVRDLFEASKFKEAEAEIQKFMEDMKNPPRRSRGDEEALPTEVSPSLLFVLGNLYFQAGRQDEARSRFLEAIEEFPRFRRAHTNLGFLYISQNKMDLALPMLQRAVELGESSGRVYGLIGYCHLTAGNALAAENAYRQAYLLNPSARDWKLGLTQALVTQEKHAEAISMIGSLLKENPNDKALWLQQASSYLALDKKQDAILNLEILRRKGLADEGNLTLLGNLHMDSGEPGMALVAYQEAMKRASRPDLVKTLKSARILSDYGAPEKAGELLSTLRTMSGSTLSAEDQAAITLTEVRVARALEQPDRVSELLEQLLASRPADPEVLLETARHKDGLSRDMEEGDARTSLLREARSHYQLAIRNDATAYAAHLGLGQLLVREKRYDEALPHLEAALQAKRSESLEQYVSRVRRATDRMKQRATATPQS